MNREFSRYGEEPSVVWKENMQITHVRKWMDVLQLKGAQVLAEFKDGYGCGRPAVTVNHYGKGMVYYIAAEPMEDLMQNIVSHISQACSHSQMGFAQQGAELKLRKGRKKEYLFALNHTAHMYGDWACAAQGCSERVIGEWLHGRGRRSAILLSSKGCHPPIAQMSESRVDVKSLRENVESSMKNLRTDYIDLYFSIGTIHWFRLQS